jgi:hypothetical protein
MLIFIDKALNGAWSQAPFLFWNFGLVNWEIVRANQFPNFQISQFQNQVYDQMIIPLHI